MELKFNLDDISKRVFALEKILREQKNTVEYDFADDAMKTYQDILTDSTNNFNSNEKIDSNFSFNKYHIINVLNRNKAISKYFPKDVVRFLSSICKDLTKNEDFFDKFNRTYELEEKDFSDQDIYDTLLEFYNKYAPGYKHILDFLIDNNLIHLKDYCYENDSSCYYDEYFDLPYAIVNNHHNAGVFPRVIHEVAHSYWYTINKKNNYSSRYFIETPANLAEFLYAKDNLENDQNLISLYSYFGSLKETFYDIALVDNLKQHPISKTTILSVMKKQNYFLFCGDDKNLEYFSKINNFRDASYAFSLILTLHLLKIFDDDFEKGLYLYNNHVFKNSSNFLNDLKAMEFDLHDLDYSKELYENYENMILGQVRKRLK